MQSGAEIPLTLQEEHGRKTCEDEAAEANFLASHSRTTRAHNDRSR